MKCKVLTPRICDLEYPEVVKPAIPPKEKKRDYPALIEKVSLPY
jgi:hypothetical protein